jgi:hypothetical protein
MYTDKVEGSGEKKKEKKMEAARKKKRHGVEWASIR